MNVSDATRSVNIGGYAHSLRPAVAGRFGCDPCFFCGVRPAEGAAVWHTCYGDVVCDGCSAPAVVTGDLYHGDYMTYHLHCAELDGVPRVGDVVWAPPQDSMNPWREVIVITAVLGNGWFDADVVGGRGPVGLPQLRWFAPSTRWFVARTVAEADLGRRGDCICADCRFGGAR